MEEIRRFLGERLEFFHDLWTDGSEYCAIEITYDYGAWACWMVPRGGYLSELPQEETIQWCNALTGEPFDRSEPVLENMCLIPMKE